MEKRWGGEGGGQQQSLMLPWKRVYASLMHLVDPIRGWLCLHRHTHACSGVMHAHTHAYVHIQEPMCVSARRVYTGNIKHIKLNFVAIKTTNLWETKDKVHSHKSWRLVRCFLRGTRFRDMDNFDRFANFTLRLSPSHFSGNVTVKEERPRMLKRPNPIMCIFTEEGIPLENRDI